MTTRSAATRSAATRADEPFVVVGSGPSGAVAADALIAAGADVVLLDAGPAAPGGVVVRAAGNTVFRRMGYSHYRTDRVDERSAGVTWVSSLSHGGLSNFWTAAVPRFAPDDFTEGGRVDERYVWPVGYDELVPYYERAERLLGVTVGDSIPGVPDPLARHRYSMPDDWTDVIQHAVRNGDGVGAIPMAKGDPWMVARRGTEFSSYHCVVAPLRESPGFELRSHAHVTRLLWSASRGRVDEVEYVDREHGEIRRQRTRGVVLAAGAVDSTMILLRSTSSDFPLGLGNTHGVVGRYLHDHPREWWPATLARPMRALAHPVYIARRPHADSPPLMATSHTIGLVAPRERLKTWVRASTRSIGVQVFGTMVPQPEIGITLPDRAASPGAMVEQRPVIGLRYDDAATENIESSRERLVDVFGRAGLDVEVPGPFHELMPGSSVHLAGTVRMHDDPTFGALDRWNRLHDAPNVAVTDLSCFTTGPEKNPTPTAMALSIRAAERLAGDIGVG